MHTPFLASSAPFVEPDIDNSEALGLGTDLCTAIRLSIYCIEAGLTPIPTAIVNMAYPCDAAPMLHQVVMHNKEWQHVPVFTPDPPYHGDERSIEYFAKEYKQMAAFLEQHFHRKLDIDRLREVVTESNKQYALWQEYNELRRAVPCPHGWSFGGANCFAMAQIYRTGDPRGTEWFRKLVELAENKVRLGQGAIAKEKIRFLWFDILPMGWCYEFLPWLEQEWGAVMVMDMFTNAPYNLIDTSTEESMFRGLAKRNLLEVPMVRQATGTADTFANDIVRLVKDYKLDCVIWPGHMGHKDSAASVGIMREVCRDMGVPFLHIGLDLFDKRYAGMEAVKEKVSQFFTTMGLG
jgi:benzoyl-CoA reductase subunit B